MGFKHLKVQRAQCFSCGPSVHHGSVRYEMDDLAQLTDLASSGSSLQVTTGDNSQELLVEPWKVQQRTNKNEKEALI